MQQNAQNVAPDAMTAAAVSTRRTRGIHPKRAGLQQLPRGKGSNLPEYLEAVEIRAIIAAAPHARAKLLMLTQWRAGLRVSEAPALERADLVLSSDRPTLRVRRGKGNKVRVVPVHPELQNALASVLEFADVGDGRVIDVGRSIAWRWVQPAVSRAVELGAIAPGRKVGTHTLHLSNPRTFPCAPSSWPECSTVGRFGAFQFRSVYLW